MNKITKLSQKPVNYLDVSIDKDKQHADYDLINDIGIYPRTNDDKELVGKRLKDADFRKLVQSLNIEQKEFFLPCTELC